MRKLFGTDGIRAIAGEPPLDKRTIHAIGLALARHLGHQPRLILGPARVLIGLDTRESGPWIASTLNAGLISGGATVESAGIITTPAVAHLARTHGFSAGIVISASHNPWQDNGIKIFGGDGYKLPDATELAIEAEIERVLATTTYTEADEPLPATNDAFRAEYVRFLLDAVPNLSLDNRTVVIDCANGAASSIAPQLFANLAGTVKVTHASPNGRMTASPPKSSASEPPWASPSMATPTAPSSPTNTATSSTATPSCSPAPATSNPTVFWREI
jgi:phosphoglucosamine mutase